MVPTKRRLATGLALLLTGPAPLAATREHRPFAVPSGYAWVANACGVPPAVLYGVALQESALLFGEPRERTPLPWPWTLNVAGTPARFATRAAAEERLRSVLGGGIDNVDIGPMGINWRHHKERLVSVGRSLDPYWNLRVGAALLTNHFAVCGNWADAVGRYHSPGNRPRADSYSALVFARLRRLRHA